MSLNLEDLMAEMDFRVPQIVKSQEEAEDGDSIVAEDGIYKLVRALIGDFWIKSESFKTKMAGMPQLAESFIKTTTIPKIPGKLFYGIIRFYRKIYETNKNEVMAQIWWDKERQEFLVEVPEQEVAGASISYKRSGGWYDDPNKVLVLTSHSHHTMGAFYSGTDNSDEKGKHGIYSFVFGNLVNNADNTFSYKTVQRACCADALIPLAIEDIFDFSDESQFGFDVPEEDYAKVKAKVYNFGVYGSYGKTAKKTTPPYTPPTPSNVSKVTPREYYYDDVGQGYGYPYSSWDYPYDNFDNRFGGLTDTYGSTDLEGQWLSGNEAASDKKRFASIFTAIRNFCNGGDTIMYSDDEFREIEAIASDFINALSVPDTHPYYVFARGIQLFMSSLVENISDVYSGERSGTDVINDPSKVLCLAIASAIHDVDTQLSIAKDTRISNDMDKAGVNGLHLPERIAAYLEKF